MDLKLLASAAVLLTGLSLLAYALHDSVNAALHIASSPFNSFLQSIALGIGLSIVLAFAYPYARGIKRGDRLAASAPMRQQASQQGMAFPAVFMMQFASVGVTALEDGRVGQKIRVALANGKRAEGVITSYSGTFSPATIQLTEFETG